jgi:hypothetical protein
MPDRAWLFLGSVVMVLLSLAGAGWLVISGQVFGLDGLFMLLVFLTTALAFALFVWNLIAMALDEIAKEREPKPAAGKRAPAPSSASAQT